MKNPRPSKKQKTQPNLILYSLGFEPDIIDKLLYLIECNDEVKNKGIKDKHIIWTLLYWKQYLPITEICVTFGISPKTFLNHYGETIHALWVVCKEIMEQRYEQLVESVGFLKHPITKVNYRAIAADSTSIDIETPTDYQIQKKFYSGKSKSHVVKFHCEVSTTSYRLLLLHPEGFPGAVHDIKIADQIYMEKDHNGEPQYYSNGRMIRRHDKFPILGDRAYISLPNFVVPHKRSKKKKEKPTPDQVVHNNFKKEQSLKMTEMTNVNKKVPVTLITGFLGSGKTTFLNYILNENHGKKIAVIQNEYGQSIGIETAMIVDSNGEKIQEWLEFPNGCICCTVKDDFLQSIEDLLKRSDKFDYILIESTGMGDPGQISASLWVDEELESPIYFDSIITLVDSKHIEKHIEKSKLNNNNNNNNKEKEKDKEEEEEDIEVHGTDIKYYSTEVERQIAFADIILLNKIDLLDQSNLNNEIKIITDRIKSINPIAKIITTERSVVPLDKVLDVKAYNPNIDLLKDYLEQLQKQEQQTHNHQHNNEDESKSCGECSTKSNHSKFINTVCITEDGDVDLTEFNRWIGNLLWEDKKDCIFRCKGLISVKGDDEKYILQGVYATFEVLPSGLLWSKDEKRHNKIVLIGESLNQNELEQSFKNKLL
ncbi:hypothetical protein RB653_006003 [Dictyostelium firmibasis]|uniref:CobW C-terminal domain-containing protein n=1 Tax=Dictyostelium firmibasis TaxID=79012 RepID=A0AAN7Z1P1_9MYCE